MFPLSPLVSLVLGSAILNIAKASRKIGYASWKFIHCSKCFQVTSFYRTRCLTERFLAMDHSVVGRRLYASFSCASPVLLLARTFRHTHDTRIIVMPIGLFT